MVKYIPQQIHDLICSNGSHKTYIQLNNEHTKIILYNDVNEKIYKLKIWCFLFIYKSIKEYNQYHNKKIITDLIDYIKHKIYDDEFIRRYIIGFICDVYELYN